MGRNILADNPVYVVGIGFHRYQRKSEATYVSLGLTAVREALADAAIAWTDVETAYTGTALLGMGSSRIMLSRLGSTGIPMAQVENASASGSTAVAQACLDVASGQSDVALALGVDKPKGGLSVGPGEAGIKNLEGGTVAPFTHFALLASEYMEAHGVSAEQVASVAQLVDPQESATTSPLRVLHDIVSRLPEDHLDRVRFETDDGLPEVALPFGPLAVALSSLVEGALELGDEPIVAIAASDEVSRHAAADEAGAENLGRRSDDTAEVADEEAPQDPAPDAAADSDTDVDVPEIAAPVDPALAAKEAANAPPAEAAIEVAADTEIVIEVAIEPSPEEGSAS